MMNVIGKAGLVLGCAIVGFCVVSWIGAGHLWADQLTERRAKAEPTAMEAAEVVCLLAERSRKNTECSVNAFEARIEVTVIKSKHPAENICTTMSDMISAETDLFYGRGWTIRVTPTTKAGQKADLSPHTCGIR